MLQTKHFMIGYTGTKAEIEALSTVATGSLALATDTDESGFYNGAAWDWNAVTSGTLAQFAATTSAQLAGVLSDETGSGAAVFADAPTFSAAPTIAPTSPTDGTDFLKFTLERAWTLQQSATAGNAMLEFFSDTAGKYVRINPNSANAGGLYIGQYTSAAPEMLHLIGSGNIKAAVESTLNTGCAFNRLRNNTPANFDFGLYGSAHGSTLYGISTNSLATVSTGAGALLLGTAGASSLYFGTNSTTKVTIDSNGLQAHTMTSTATGGSVNGAGYSHSITPASASTAEYRSLSFINFIGVNAADTTTFNSVIGGYFQNRPRTTGTITNTIGAYIQGVTLDSSSGNASVTTVYGAQIYGTGRPSGASTLTSTSILGAHINPNTITTGVTATNLYGLQIATPSAGTFTTGIGIVVDAQTRAATTNVGIRIAAPSGATNNYALQLSDTSGTLAGGITFGTDTNLYRSAANTLKTDDAVIISEGLIVNNNAGATGDLQAQSDTEPNMLLLDASADTLYLGGSTNGVKITKGGELTLIGTATRWNDLRVEPVVRTTGAKAPTFAAYKTNVYLYDFDNAVLASEKEIFFTVQLPHDWKEGSTIYPHIHWVNRTTGTAGHVVKWAMDYTKAKIGATFGATSNISGTAIVGGGDITVADEHMITSLTAITMTGDTISTVLICRAYRNSSDAADTYTGTAGLLYVDFHYEIDTIGGSADEFTK